MIKYNQNNNLNELTPGFYNIDFTEYLNIDAVNNSTISNMIKYPHGFKSLNNSTQSMSFGTMFHTYMLENNKFDDQYLVTSALDKRTKEYKEAVKECQEDGRTLITLTEYNNILVMAEVLQSCDIYLTLMDGAKHEVSMIFDYSGVKCKARADAINFKGDKAVIIDLKTIGSLEPYMLRRNILDYGYIRQAAFYNSGVKTLLPDYDPVFINVFIETPSASSKSIGCAIYAFEEADILEAELLVDSTIKSIGDKKKILSFKTGVQ